MVYICDLCEVNASQEDSFICEQCSARIEIPMEGDVLVDDQDGQSTVEEDHTRISVS